MKISWTVLKLQCGRDFVLETTGSFLAKLQQWVLVTLTPNILQTDIMWQV